MAGDGGSYRDRAAAAAVDATGWNWSAKFGDLDSDAALDVYVVNGFIAVQVFGHLDGDRRRSPTARAWRSPVSDPVTLGAAGAAPPLPRRRQPASDAGTACQRRARHGLPAPATPG